MKIKFHLFWVTTMQSLYPSRMGLFSIHVKYPSALISEQSSRASILPKSAHRFCHTYILHWCLILDVHYVEVLKMFDMTIFFFFRVRTTTISYQLQSDWTIEDKKDGYITWLKLLQYISHFRTDIYCPAFMGVWKILFSKLMNSAYYKLQSLRNV